MFDDSADNGIIVHRRRRDKEFFNEVKEVTEYETKVGYLIDNINSLLEHVNTIYNNYIKTVSLNYSDHIVELDYIINSNKSETFLVIKKINNANTPMLTLCDWLVDEDGYIVELDRDTLLGLLNRYQAILTWYYANYKNNSNSKAITNSKKIKPYIIQIETIVDIFYNVIS